MDVICCGQYLLKGHIHMKTCRIRKSQPHKEVGESIRVRGNNSGQGLAGGAMARRTAVIVNTVWSQAGKDGHLLGG